MDDHQTLAIKGRSVRVVRRAISDSRRVQAGSPSRVEHDSQPAAHLVGLGDLEEIASRVRRLTVRDESSSDIKLDLQRMIGRLKKRFNT